MHELKISIGVCVMALENDQKSVKELACHLQNWHKEFGKF